VALHRIVEELEDDADVQVVVFAGELPDFFVNHYDGAAAADLPTPAHEGDNPVWTDMVLRLSKASYVSIATIRDRARGAGNELALACDLGHASREKAFFGQPSVGIVPGAAAPSDSRAPSAATAHWRPRSAAPTTTPTWPSGGDGSPELDAFVDTTVPRLASFGRQALATAKSIVNRATLPPDADLVANQTL